jgi:hypothetical protein
MKKLLVMLMATLFVAAPWAAEPNAKSKSDEPVAKVADLTGLVTVSRSNTLGNAIKDTPEERRSSRYGGIQHCCDSLQRWMRHQTPTPASCQN